MNLRDIFVFSNRIGVRHVNDMIAQVAVQVTPAGTCALPDGAQQMVSNKAFTKHMEMASVLVVSNDAPVQCVHGGVGGVAGAVQATENTSPVMPSGCLAVHSKEGRLYGKRVSDVHLVGFSVEMNSVDDRVIRFRKRDHKTVVGDMLVAMGRYAKVKTAQEIILKMIERKDDKIKDLESLEVDMDLLENKVCIFFVISHISVMGGRKTAHP